MDWEGMGCAAPPAVRHETARPHFGMCRSSRHRRPWRCVGGESTDATSGPGGPAASRPLEAMCTTTIAEMPNQLVLTVAVGAGTADASSATFSSVTAGGSNQRPARCPGIRSEKTTPNALCLPMSQTLVIRCRWRRLVRASTAGPVSASCGNGAKASSACKRPAFPATNPSRRTARGPSSPAGTPIRQLTWCGTRPIAPRSPWSARQIQAKDPR